ncbi:MAG: hypothetical protein H7839_10640 [Magnetococcus sp. YQC-5]
MRFINFVGKTPVNTPAHPDYPSWEPWTQTEWDTWLAKSRELLDHLWQLNQLSNKTERNHFIDDHSSHWGKLKLWLQVLSHGKCWFSEVRDLFSHYDVEHFRPKKEAQDLNGSKRDAYWWLAFEYTNYRLIGNVGNRMKGTWFPLKAGSLVSTCNNQCEKSEEPYFLDPTDHYDVSLIAFNEEGKAIPTPGISQWEQDRVDAFIKHLKLNEHEPLTEERRKIWQATSRAIETYKTERSKLNTGVNPVVQNTVKEYARKIYEMTQEEKELSAVAKWCVLFRNDPCLNRLVV